MVELPLLLNCKWALPCPPPPPPPQKNVVRSSANQYQPVKIQLVSTMFGGQQWVGCFETHLSNLGIRLDLTCLTQPPLPYFLVTLPPKSNKDLEIFA